MSHAINHHSVPIPHSIPSLTRSSQDQDSAATELKRINARAKQYSPVYETSGEIKKKQLDDERMKRTNLDAQRTRVYDVPYWSGLPFSLLAPSTGG